MENEKKIEAAISNYNCQPSWIFESFIEKWTTCKPVYQISYSQNI